MRYTPVAMALLSLLSLHGERCSGDEMARPIRLSSPVTHSDWILATEPAPAWGPEGVRQILDRARECGWERVYWRCFGYAADS